MNDFENQLDDIRIKLYEETKEMSKEEIIRNVNANAQKIAREFGIKFEKRVQITPVSALCNPATI